MLDTIMIYISCWIVTCLLADQIPIGLNLKMLAHMEVRTDYLGCAVVVS